MVEAGLWGDPPTPPGRWMPRPFGATVPVAMARVIKFSISRRNSLAARCTSLGSIGAGDSIRAGRRREAEQPARGSAEPPNEACRIVAAAPSTIDEADTWGGRPRLTCRSGRAFRRDPLAGGSGLTPASWRLAVAGAVSDRQRMRPLQRRGYRGHSRESMPRGAERHILRVLAAIEALLLRRREHARWSARSAAAESCEPS